MAIMANSPPDAARHDRHHTAPIENSHRAHRADAFIGSRVPTQGR